MATKKQELENPGSCLNKAGDDEPVFVLRAKDPCAPHTICSWANISEATGSQSVEKISEAYAVADQFREWRLSGNESSAKFDESIVTVEEVRVLRKVVDRLNEMLETDPDTISDLFLRYRETRVTMAERFHHAVVEVGSEGTFELKPMTSAFSLFGASFGRLPNGSSPLLILVDPESNRILQFSLSSACDAL